MTETASDMVAQVTEDMRKIVHRGLDVVFGDRFKACKWSVPIFDMCALPSGDDDGDLASIVESNVLPPIAMPYRVFVTVSRYIPKMGDASVTASVNHFRLEDDGRIIVQMFGRSEVPSKQLPISWVPNLTVIFTPTGQGTFSWLVLGLGGFSPGYLSEKYNAFEMARAVQLINMPPEQIRSVAGELGKVAVIINQKRAGDKRKPIQAPRILSLSRIVDYDNDSVSGFGAPRSPHDRRGHWRRYQSGKVIWISDMKIHGGSVNAPLYEVVS